jgi:deoxyribodipyrimidine photo-lyase
MVIMKNLVWFREDLRISDNTALYQAAKEPQTEVFAIYILDAGLWERHHVAPCRVQFILDGLQDLSKSLNKLKVPLLIDQVDNTEQIPKLLHNYIKKYQIENLFFNQQYEINEKRRDQLVCDYLSKRGIQCNSYHDQLILHPGTVLTKSGKFFSVFTPFKRAWYKEFNTKKIVVVNPVFKKNKKKLIKSTIFHQKLLGISENIAWIAGEKEAQKRLHEFIENGLFDYYKYRDFPSLSGTSQLSPYLSAGMISPRKCFIAALQANDGEVESGNKGALTWMSELIWREFYKHLLAALPRLSMNKPYQLKTEKLKWRYNEKQLRAWQEGKTGYPIIDAGMRQLNQIGWMHNRLRMIVAMFFTKNLFFDWRLGEDYFMRHLIDGDLSANNGGWQWSASTGTDAAPYFRIFNPIRQSERFDPQGDFIRRYCPELKEMDSFAIHDPHARAAELAKSVGYPTPIVDLGISRLAAISAFKKL